METKMERFIAGLVKWGCLGMTVFAVGVNLYHIQSPVIMAVMVGAGISWMFSWAFGGLIQEFKNMASDADFCTKLREKIDHQTMVSEVSQTLSLSWYKNQMMISRMEDFVKKASSQKIEIGNDPKEVA